MDVLPEYWFSNLCTVRTLSVLCVLHVLEPVVPGRCVCVCVCEWGGGTCVDHYYVMFFNRTFV